MQLVMYLGNDFIASVCLNDHQISQPGYMGKLKRRLIEENSQLLQDVTEEPEFLLTDLPSRKTTKHTEPKVTSFQ